MNKKHTSIVIDEELLYKLNKEIKELKTTKCKFIIGLIRTAMDKAQNDRLAR